jgi:predicted RNA binding protein YcfA (HicA-like mRNA interferase family)
VPSFGPISRNDLIRYLREVGFQGPFAGTKHQIMVKGDITLRIPNPHQSSIGRELLARILRQASITREDWEPL